MDLSTTAAAQLLPLLGTLAAGLALNAVVVAILARGNAPRARR